MAEAQSGQERTEPATPKRRERARQEGNVARSVEVASVVVLGVALVGLAAYGGRMTDLAAGLLRFHFRELGSVSLDPDSILPFATRVAHTTALIVLPFAGLVALAGIGAHVAQVGVLLTAKPLAPKFNRISPATGIKRILSKRGMVELVKSLAKLAIVGGIVTWTLFRASEDLLPLMTVGVFAGYRAILAAMFKMAAGGALALTLLAILDFFFQRWDYEQQILMTRQEVTEEHKQSEGDPLIRSKVRARQQEISRRRMMQDVKSADVVVTNPIRYAVALRYQPAKMAAPRVVAKGARLMAKRIRDIAREAGVPIVEDPPLARALYQACKVGSDVPLAFYKAVAELLAFVYRQREARPAGAAR